MISLKKLCFVRDIQRCFKSEEIPTDFTMDLPSQPEHRGFSYLSSQGKMSEVPGFKRLQLTVVEAARMEVGQVFLLDFDGMRGSSRFNGDGRTYAGYDEKANDIILPKSEFGIGSVHFVIEFNSMSSQYLIKDQGDGTGTFVKLSSPLLLQSYHILSFGNTHMTVVLSQHKNKDKLVVKFIEGPKVGQSFVFEDTEEVVKIGRLGDCTIQFDDTSLSRYQCFIHYLPHSGWTVSDGDGSKPSTNGTWLFLDDYFPIQSKMVFKAGMTFFQVTENTGIGSPS